MADTAGSRLGGNFNKPPCVSTFVTDTLLEYKETDMPNLETAGFRFEGGTEAAAKEFTNKYKRPNGRGGWCTAIVGAITPKPTKCSTDPCSQARGTL